MTEFTPGQWVMVRDHQGKMWQRRIYLSTIDVATYPYEVVTPATELQYLTGTHYQVTCHKFIKPYVERKTNKPMNEQKAIIMLQEFIAHSPASPAQRNASNALRYLTNWCLNETIQNQEL